MLFLHEILHMAHTLVCVQQDRPPYETTSYQQAWFSHAVCRKVELLNIYLQEKFINSLIWKCKLCYCILKPNSTRHQNGCQHEVKCHTKQLQLQSSCYGLASGWEKCLQAKYVALLCLLLHIHVNCNTGFCVVSYPLTVIHTMLGLHQYIFTQRLSSQTGRSWNYSRVPTTREFPYSTNWLYSLHDELLNWAI